MKKPKYNPIPLMDIEKDDEQPLEIMGVDEYLKSVTPEKIIKTKIKPKRESFQVKTKPVKSVIPESNIILKTNIMDKLNEEPIKIKGYVLSTELKTIKDAQIIYDFDFKSFYSKWTIQYWIAKYKLKKLKRKLYLILMHLRNGKYTMFLVATNKNYFEKWEGLYFLDPDMIREDTFTKLPLLYYHQDVSIPFMIDFDLDELHKKIMANKSESPVDKALNPSSLKGFINSQVIEKVLKGQELSDEMRFIKVLIIINLLISVIIGFMFAKTQGWF